MSLGVVEADRVVDIVALIPTAGHELATGDVNGLLSATLKHLHKAFSVANLPRCRQSAARRNRGGR